MLVCLENLSLHFFFKFVVCSLFQSFPPLTIHRYSWLTLHTLLHFGALFDLKETDKNYLLHFMSNLGGHARRVVAYENSDHTVYTAWVKILPHKRTVTV